MVPLSVTDILYYYDRYSSTWMDDALFSCIDRKYTMARRALSQFGKLLHVMRRNVTLSAPFRSRTSPDCLAFEPAKCLGDRADYCWTTSVWLFCFCCERSGCHYWTDSKETLRIPESSCRLESSGIPSFANLHRQSPSTGTRRPLAFSWRLKHYFWTTSVLSAHRCHYVANRIITRTNDVRLNSHLQIYYTTEAMSRYFSMRTKIRLKFPTLQVFYYWEQYSIDRIILWSHCLYTISS